MIRRSKTSHAKLKHDTLKDPLARAEYEAFKLELMVAEQLKTARKKANLSQEAVAEKMHTQKTAIARLEAAGGREKHSPSLKTIFKYASAVGFDLRIKLIPKKAALRKLTR